MNQGALWQRKTTALLHKKWADGTVVGNGADSRNEMPNVLRLSFSGRVLHQKSDSSRASYGLFTSTGAPSNRISSSQRCRGWEVRTRKAGKPSSCWRLAKSMVARRMQLSSGRRGCLCMQLPNSTGSVAPTLATIQHAPKALEQQRTSASSSLVLVVSIGSPSSGPGTAATAASGPRRPTAAGW